MDTVIAFLFELLEKLALSSLSNTSTRGNYQKDVVSLKDEIKNRQIKL